MNAGTASPNPEAIPGARRLATVAYGDPEPGGPGVVARGPWWRTAATAAVALALALGLLALIWQLARPLGLLLAAIVLATGLAPIAGWLGRRLPRTAAIALVYTLLLLALAGVGWVVIPRTVDQLAEALTLLPWALESAEASTERQAPGLGSQVREAVEAGLPGILRVAMQAPVEVLSALLELLLVIALAAYLAVAAPASERFALSLLAPEHRERAAELFEELGEAMGSAVRAHALSALIVAVLVFAGLVVIGVEYPLVLALLAGLGEFVPVVGPLIAMVPALIVALLASPTQALMVLALYAVLQQVESYLLTPRLVRDHAHIPPALAIFALMAGAALLGILGAVIAIPVAGALRVLVLRVLVPYIRRRTGAARTAEAAPAG